MQLGPLDTFSNTVRRNMSKAVVLKGSLLLLLLMRAHADDEKLDDGGLAATTTTRQRGGLLHRGSRELTVKSLMHWC
jgi:hypothetical protein